MTEDTTADFFTGRTERYLYEKLKQEGQLKFQDIFGSYSNRDTAKSFIQKLLQFKVAVFAETPALLLHRTEEIEKESGKKEEEKKRKESVIPSETKG